MQININKRYRLYLTAILAGLTSTGCAGWLDKLADNQVEKRQLNNGKAVFINYNLTPSAEWGCTKVGEPQSYNWGWLQTKGQFHLSGARGLLLDNALDYANEHNLDANYINLQIPDEVTFTTGSSKVTDSTDLHPADKAIASYYQCQKINPQHKLGVIKKTDIGITVNPSK
jgi:hypothetical protein